MPFSVVAKVDTIEIPNEKSLYILDGDSISLQMRLYGIDTPEKKQKCQEVKDKYVDCGILAKKALKYIFQKIKGKIKIDPIASDHYGRLLVKVYRNDIDIGKSMVRAGVAFAYGKIYKQQEILAKKEKLGFWSYYQKPQIPSKWRKNKKKSYKKTK